MAEESIEGLVTPEKNEFDSENSAENPGSLNNGHSNHSRASIGSYHTGDSSTSYSTEKPDSAQIKRIVPHYLRASTGSCHDFCKYGRKHVFDEKPWKRVQKGSAKPSPSELNSVQITVSGKQKKEKVNKKYSPELKPSPRQNGSSSNETRLSKYKPSPTEKSPSSDPTKNMKIGLGILLPSEKVEVQVKEGYVDREMSKTEKKTDDGTAEHFSSVKPKERVQAKPSSSSDYSDIGKGRRNCTTASSKARKSGKLKLASPLKGRNGIIGVETETSKNEVPEKTLHVITEDNVLKKKTSLSHAKSQSLSSHEEDYADKTVTAVNVPMEMHNVQPMKDNRKKTVKKSKVVVSEDKYKSPVKLKFRSGRVVDVQSDINIPRRLKFRRARVENNVAANEFVSNKNECMEIGNIQPVKEISQNKTLRKSKFVVSQDKYRSPIKLIRSGKVVGAPRSDSNVPWKLKFRRARVVNDEAANEFVSNKNESMEINNNIQLVKENKNKTLLRKTKLVVSQDKYRSPIKLVRSVKVAVGIPQSDTNVPLRLKFRRAKPAVPEDAKGDTSRRVFKKGAVKNGAVGAVLPSEKVTLKHRNVQGKKDAQGLFNNVIEETASKLVESRKSKVKALVGAFETVISLQERKPST